MPGYVKDPKIRLYLNMSLVEGGDITLSKDDSHYILNVMRLGDGAEIALFNGQDGEWLGTISLKSKKQAIATPTKKLKDQSLEPDVWLLFAPIKKARIDFMVQKATELGALMLMPIQTRHTAMDRVKEERLRANAKEAAEQCGRMAVPIVTSLQKFEVVMAKWPDDRHIMFCDEDLSGLSAIDALKEAPKGKWAIFIGPEGGWSDDERDWIKKHPKALTVSLGHRVLRADTAAISALTLFQSILGDWA